jgi:hypothetical protein
MKRNSLLSLLATIILFVSCGENKNIDSTTVSQEKKEEQPKPAPAKASGEARSTIRLTITGDAMAGTYDAVCTEACCSYGIAGDKTFGNQYSVTGKGPKELSSVQLIVDNVTGNKSTKEFLLTVSFGELFTKDSKSFTINTRNDYAHGSGTLELQYSGEKAEVHIKGTSKEGAQIDLQMECNKMVTPENLLKEAADL